MVGIYETLDERFNPCRYGDRSLEVLYQGGRWAEGPAYVPAGRYLVWSDIPNDRLLRWDETTGSYEGHRGENEIGARNVYRVDPGDGSLTVVATDFDNPNGLVFNADESRLYVSDSSDRYLPSMTH